MRKGLENPPRIFLFATRDRADEIERGHRGSARAAGGLVSLRGAASEEASTSHRVFWPCRGREYSYERDGGLHQTRCGPPRRCGVGRIVPANYRVGRKHHRRTRHRPCEEALVAAGGSERDARVASHGEARAGSAWDFESGEVYLENFRTF